MMMAAGLWKVRRVRKIVTHQMRERRPCLGELVQIDGSPHDWVRRARSGLCAAGIYRRRPLANYCNCCS